MSTLPHEILLHVIRHLSRDELLQCQLTCKQWHDASLVFLYTTLEINSEETARLYIHTISDSPALGKYLKTIEFRNVFKESMTELPFDCHSVLDAVIRRCPNISKMENTDNRGFPFWTQLMHAARTGQLPNLKYLPLPSSMHLMAYTYAVLSLGNSLAQLCLHDNGYIFGPQLARLGVYQTLCNHIDRFKNLESLSLIFLSDKQLSYFDGLIDKCHHLKELEFDLRINQVLPPSEPEPAIHPRPDIHTLVCNWKPIDAESQLEYVMCKFPNLKKLVITPGLDTNDDTPNCSGPTLVKFIQHALSIPYFKIEIDIRLLDLLHISTVLTETKPGAKNLTIGYQSTNFLNSIELSSENKMSIFFSSDIGYVYDDEEEEDKPPHIQFFYGAGRTIRSLTVNMCQGIPCVTNVEFPTIDWLYDILDHCPLIEEITTEIFSYLLPSHRTVQYPSVKRMVISLAEYTKSTYSLDSLSLNLPNLHQIYFDLYFVKESYKEPIAVHMPHTSLDLLTWNETRYDLRHFRGTEIYIKLKTDAGTKFYLGIRNTLFPIDSTRFDFYTKYMRFDIRCKQLKELRIRRITSPESDANLVF